MGRKVLLIQPEARGEQRGNAITVTRWAEGLRRRGVDVVVSEPKTAFEGPLDFDLIHGHHARHSGEVALALGERLQVPVVLSLGGTEFAPERTPEELRSLGSILERARLVIGADQDLLDDLRTKTPQPSKFLYVPRGVMLPPPCSPRRKDGFQTVLALGGLRPVKRQLALVQAFRSFTNRGIATRLILAGAPIDVQYSEEIRALAQGSSAIEIRGEVRGSALSALWEETDVLINASEIEGSSNAILEAWAHGKPVVASDVMGNRGLLRGAPPSIARLFPLMDDEGLLIHLKDLSRMSDTERGVAAEMARMHVALRHDPEVEIEGLLRGYESIVNKAPPGKPSEE